MCKSSPSPAIPRICWVFLSSLVACSNPSGDTSFEQRSDGLGTPSPSDEAGGCHGLLPINLGPGVEKQLQPPTDDFCFGPPFIDGQGHLAVDFFNTQYQTASWIILDSSGTQIGSFRGPGLVSVEPQQDGYMGLPVPEADFPTLTLRSWSSTGALLGSAVLTSGRSYSRIAALDPEGGVLVFRTEPIETEGAQLTAQRYDQLAVARGPAVPITILRGYEPTAGTVDRRGLSLVVYDEQPASNEACFLGRWFRADGTPLDGPFLIYQGSAPSFERLQLVPLIGGGVAVSVNGDWVARIPSGRPHALPPPHWLAERPASLLPIVRGGRAYAIPASTAEGDLPQIELVTAQGRSCGRFTLPAPARSVTIGRDGTVAEEIGYCHYQWWPQLLE